jgi:hypothetical protein
MKNKIYMANGVHLSYIPPEQRGSNGNAQFTILCLTTTKKRVAELCDRSTTVHHLNKYGGLCVRTDGKNGFHGEHIHLDICKKPDTIYYFVEHTKNGYVGKWFEYLKHV